MPTAGETPNLWQKPPEAEAAKPKVTEGRVPDVAKIDSSKVAEAAKGNPRAPEAAASVVKGITGTEPPKNVEDFGKMLDKMSEAFKDIPILGKLLELLKSLFSGDMPKEDLAKFDTVKDALKGGKLLSSDKESAPLLALLKEEIKAGDPNAEKLATDRKTISEHAVKELKANYPWAKFEMLGNGNIQATYTKDGQQKTDIVMDKVFADALCVPLQCVNASKQADGKMLMEKYFAKAEPKETAPWNSPEAIKANIDKLGNEVLASTEALKKEMGELKKNYEAKGGIGKAVIEGSNKFETYLAQNWEKIDTIAKNRTVLNPETDRRISTLFRELSAELHKANGFFVKTAIWPEGTAKIAALIPKIDAIKNKFA